MNSIPTNSRLFIDTNTLLYAITDHPRFGSWCNSLLDRIHQGEVVGYISVIVLNELIHKLIVGEIAQKTGLKADQAILYLKRNREMIEELEAFDVVNNVETGYGLISLGVTIEDFQETRRLMRFHKLLSNDALHLAIMQKEGISDVVTNDRDFDGIANIQVWKPLEELD